MSMSGIGGAYAPYDGMQKAGASPDARQEQLTTVTTHCNKEHWHDKSCPHTTTTMPAPKAGQPGYLLDTKA